MRVLWAAFLVSGCSLGGSDGDQAPVECASEGADRTGSYLITFTEREGGTCGSLSSAVFDRANPMLDASCVLQAKEWTECTFRRSFECAFEASDTRLKTTEVTTQTVSDGSRIEGTSTRETSSLETGEVTCTSTYDWLAERQ